MTTPSPPTTTTAERGILVVDDDRRNRFVARAVLEVLGRPIVEAASASEALKAIGEQEFAVVLLDIMMPGTNGIELLETLRKHGLAERTPIVILSALDSEGPFAARARTLGITDFFSKPFDPDRLRARVGALLTTSAPSESDAHRESRQREVEEARELARHLLEATQQLDQAAREKDKYLGMLGHDLRNPLSAVLTGTATLLRSPDLSDAHKATVSRIQRSAERMAGLVRDILDFARGNVGGAIPIHCAPTNLGDICDAVVEELQLAHPKRTFRVDKRGALEGHWDRDRIEQALSNLVGNAVEHSEADIKVSAEAERDHIHVRVWNPGPAITRDRLAGIFEPFKKGSKGLGLGLYIAREIVRAHGGSIDVASMSEAGTTFSIRLPRYVSAG